MIRKAIIGPKFVDSPPRGFSATAKTRIIRKPSNPVAIRPNIPKVI